MLVLYKLEDKDFQKPQIMKMLEDLESNMNEEKQKLLINKAEKV